MRKASARGFTLLEMIVVITILGILATAVVAVVEKQDDQVRYLDTRNRMQAIRDAVVGHPDRTLNGQPDLAGFVSDMGRLPASISELTTPAGAGWRGPYLRGTNLDGSFPDGWGSRVIDPVNYGWDWAIVTSSSPTTVSANLITFGSDGVPGTSGPDTTADLLARIQDADWRVPVLAGTSMTVELRSSIADLSTRSLTLRIVYGPEAVDFVQSSPSSFGVPGGFAQKVPFAFPATAVPVGYRSIVVWDVTASEVLAVTTVTNLAPLMVAPRSTLAGIFTDAHPLVWNVP